MEINSSDINKTEMAAITSWAAAMSSENSKHNKRQIVLGKQTLDELFPELANNKEKLQAANEVLKNPAKHLDNDEIKTKIPAIKAWIQKMSSSKALYDAMQAGEEILKRLSGSTADNGKPLSIIAEEVLNGKYGNISASDKEKIRTYKESIAHYIKIKQKLDTANNAGNDIKQHIKNYCAENLLGDESTDISCIFASFDSQLESETAIDENTTELDT